MALIKLLADPDDDTLPPPPPKLRGGDFPIDGLLLDLQYEREAKKRREAAFLSILGHGALLFLLLTAPRWAQWLHLQPVPLRLAQNRDWMEPKDMTYLEMPKSLIKPPVKPKAISDQDRHFEQPTPITDSRSVPVPAPKPPAPAPAPPSAASPAPTSAPPAPAPQPAPVAPSKPADEGLKLQDIPHPQRTAPLPFGSSASATIQQAMKNVSQNQSGQGPSITEGGHLPRRGNTAGGTAAQGDASAGAQILSDTKGVDFSAWLQRVVDTVRENWFAVMPETVYLGTQGKTFIVFDVNQDGSIAHMSLVGPSGTVSLDTAAQSAIQSSNPFQHLPNAFHDPSIRLEFGFFYNLTPDDGH